MLRRALPVVIPAVAQIAVALVGGVGARGVFQADLAAMVALTGVGAFLLRPGRTALCELAAGVIVTAGVHVVLVGGTAGTLAYALLAAACGVTATGIAGFGRAVGVPRVAAGGVASGVLWLAMTGLFWADDLAARLPESARRDARQAVLHVDLATACAYDAAAFDRMHDADVYDRVPLASTLMGRPSAPHTAMVWLVVGSLFWSAALLLRPAAGDLPDATD